MRLLSFQAPDSGVSLLGSGRIPSEIRPISIRRRPIHFNGCACNSSSASVRTMSPWSRLSPRARRRGGLRRTRTEEGTDGQTDRLNYWRRHHSRSIDEHDKRIGRAQGRRSAIGYHGCEYIGAGRLRLAGHEPVPAGGPVAAGRTHRHDGLRHQLSRGPRRRVPVRGAGRLADPRQAPDDVLELHRARLTPTSRSPPFPWGRAASESEREGFSHPENGVKKLPTGVAAR